MYLTQYYQYDDDRYLSRPHQKNICIRYLCKHMFIITVIVKQRPLVAIVILMGAKEQVS